MVQCTQFAFCTWIETQRRIEPLVSDTRGNTGNIRYDSNHLTQTTITYRPSDHTINNFTEIPTNLASRLSGTTEY